MKIRMYLINIMMIEDYAAFKATWYRRNPFHAGRDIGTRGICAHYKS